jgi:hypothetical protein
MAVTFTAPGEEMKVILALSIVSLAAASALAYGAGDAAHGVGGLGVALSEPAYMLLSGTILIGIAGAVRRLSL